MEPGKVKYKQIPLLPTPFMLDVWVGETRNVKPVFMGYYRLVNGESLAENEAAIIESGYKSGAKGETRLTIKLRNLNDKGVIVHEVIHTVFHLAKLIKETVKEEHEMWAYMGGYIFDEIMKGGYTEK